MSFIFHCYFSLLAYFIQFLFDKKLTQLHRIWLNTVVWKINQTSKSALPYIFRILLKRKIFIKIHSKDLHFYIFYECINFYVVSKIEMFVADTPANSLLFLFLSLMFFPLPYLDLLSRLWLSYFREVAFSRLELIFANSNIDLFAFTFAFLATWSVWI